MSIFTDRRPLRQIGGIRGYLQQVAWSLRWRIGRRTVRTRVAGTEPEAGPQAAAPRRRAQVRAGADAPSNR